MLFGINVTSSVNLVLQRNHQQRGKLLKIVEQPGDLFTKGLSSTIVGQSKGEINGEMRFKCTCAQVGVMLMLEMVLNST